MKNTVKLVDLKDIAVFRMKSFIYAQYDSFENRKENPEIIGKRNHDYYWEAVGIYVLLLDLKLITQAEWDDILELCKSECQANGCKHMYFSHNNLEIPKYCISWDELINYETNTSRNINA
jgi:hypothetical protein